MLFATWLFACWRIAAACNLNDREASAFGLARAVHPVTGPGPALAHLLAMRLGPGSGKSCCSEDVACFLARWICSSSPRLAG